jgi:hypothetical protein
MTLDLAIKRPSQRRAIAPKLTLAAKTRSQIGRGRGRYTSPGRNETRTTFPLAILRFRSGHTSRGSGMLGIKRFPE